MQVKVNELSGNALDWAVAKSAGVGVHMSRGGWVVFDSDSHAEFSNGYNDSKMQMFKPSSNWAQGGVIIEREGIALLKRPMGYWVASLDRTCEGDAPLIASMRCYVASKLGDEVEIPDELFEGVEQ